MHRIILPNVPAVGVEKAISVGDVRLPQNYLVTLFDQTISNLQTVAELLVEEFDPCLHPTMTDDVRTGRYAHAVIQTLILQLRAARATQLSPEINGQRPGCINCD
jgi:hypothetical protein